MLGDRLTVDDRGTYAVTVTPDLCVGPVGHAFLFGGAMLALAVEAGGRLIDRPVVQATAQFLRFVPLNAMLTLDVAALKSGRTLAQAAVTARLDSGPVARIALGLGQRDGFDGYQWATRPSVPDPDACPLHDILPPQDHQAQFLARIEAREVPHAADDGTTRLWLRRRDGGPNDRTTLALFGDFLPLAVGRATERPGGGNSVDNVLRMLEEAEAGWIMCDMQVAAAAHGFAHGDVRLWSQSGRLLALGAQTIIQKG